jgi:hypothetical protein
MQDDQIMPSYGKVVSVDTVTKTCVVNLLEDETDLLDVRLSADSTDGLFLVPSVGSVVGVVRVNDTHSYVALYSQLDSIKIGDGTYDGLIKINDLVTKLNNLENDINSLKTAFSTWVVAPSDGGLALKTAAATWYGSSLTATVKADIENTEVTHGGL